MSVLERLGYRPEDRVVVIHADDVGMCEASVSAWIDLAEAGGISSASVMVCAPWFPAVAEICRRRPDFDVGVHAALTSEWQKYRWGPLSTRDPASGLIDAEGYFHNNRVDLYAKSDRQEVRRELGAQLERARESGITASHVDAHMFAVLHPMLLQVYVDLAIEQKLLPVVVCRHGKPCPWFGPDPETDGREMAAECRRRGVLTLDDFMLPDLNSGADELSAAKKALDALRPGLTHLIIHPARDTPELRAMDPKGWPTRVANYRAFMDPRLHEHVAAAGIQVIDYRVLQKAMYEAA